MPQFRKTTLHCTIIAASVAASLIGCTSHDSHDDSSSEPVQTTHLENYRPQLSFSPPRNWMNDPNGLVYYDGEYHLFYQYNPNGNVWGDMSWGHAVSTDLVHWEQLPIALEVEKDASGNVTQMFFSGSAVVDQNNTSGFGTAAKPPMVAVYTSLYPSTQTLADGRVVEGGTQAESIAYSTDRGRTWTKYAGNPVIAKPPAPYQDQFRDFRDPKVFWYEPDHKWVMVAVLSALHKAVFFSSPNLRDWTFMSEFGPANATGGVWECPDLFPLAIDGDSKNTKWVLLINLNPGSIAGGSGGQYFTGQFDGTRFTADNVSAGTPPAGTVFQDFEATSYAAIGWTATGDFAGAPLAAGNLPGQGGVAGFQGSRLADTFVNGDGGVGTITSPTFTVASKYINLLVGGGRHPHDPNVGDGTVPPGTLLFVGADLEGPADATYASLGWTPTGDFVGQKVPAGAIGDQQAISGFLGHGLINTFFGSLIGQGGDAPKGRLTSPAFTISKDYINFLIGGGFHPYSDADPTAVVLVVNGVVVRTASGQNNETLNWTHWDVKEFKGKQGRIVVIDENAGGWGHINADHFLAADTPALPVSTETSVNLVVDGTIVRSETGDNSETLSWKSWNVAGYAGKQAQIQIIDKNNGGWGHLLVDHIVFSPEPKDVAHWLDYGADFYATVTWNGTPDGKRVGVGWMSNWNYAGVTPTSPWRSSQSFAREFQLHTIDGQVRLTQAPVTAMEGLRRSNPYTATNLTVGQGQTPLAGVDLAAGPLELQARFMPGTASDFGFKVHTGANGDETLVGYDAVAGSVYIDRTKSGNATFDPTFAARQSAPLPLHSGAVNLRIYVDKASVTVFGGDGEVVLTDQVFPDPSSNGVSLFAKGGDAKLSDLKGWTLRSIWAGK